MTIRLGQNIDSLTAQQKLNAVSSSLAQSYSHLSSGLRINQASDDAAGLAIVSQLNSKTRVFNQAVRNVNDGVSAANIAEGALGALKQISQRQLELSEEAANGTYSTKQRGALNTEANALVDEFNRIVASTTFNGTNLFSPSLGTIIIQAGYGQTSGTLQLGFSDQLQRAVGDGTFTAGATYGAPLLPTGLAEGDFNGDGKLDFVGTIWGTGKLDVFLGNGDGTFSDAPNLTATTFDNDVQVGDFNGDGKLDIASTSGDSNVEVYFGNGNGTFKSTTTLTVPAVSTELYEGDFNGDGRADLVVNTNSGSPSVFYGNADGTFATGSLTTTGTASGVTAGDFNGDGKTDVAIEYASSVALFLSTGKSFTKASSQNIAGFAVGNASVADFNGDGYLDFITTNISSSTASVFLGNGDGTLKSPVSYATGGGAFNLTTGDFNGDGNTDFITVNFYSNTLTTFIGNGNGTFQAPKTVTLPGTKTGQSPQAIVSGDFTGDGRLDLIVPFYSGGATGAQIFTGNGSYSSTTPYLNINTQQGARDALNTVTANLNRIEAQLGSIGATTSRFNVAIGALQTESVNFQAAAGRIEDVDVADETATLSRTQILQQAAASVLAQANQEPSLALTLLR